MRHENSSSVAGARGAIHSSWSDSVWCMKAALRWVRLTGAAPLSDGGMTGVGSSLLVVAEVLLMSLCFVGMASPATFSMSLRFVGRVVLNAGPLESVEMLTWSPAGIP